MVKKFSDLCTIMKNDGEILKELLTTHGVQYGHIARKLGVHRNTITRMLNEHLIPAERLLQIGRVLKIDIVSHFPRLKTRLAEEADPTTVNEPDPIYESLAECQKDLISLQKKYIALLEDYNELLRERQNRNLGNKAG